jgi:PilZ domain
VELLACDSTDSAVTDAPPRAPRRRMFKAGTIEFGGGGIDCTVRNISETGAALEVNTPLYIPDRVTLFVPTEQLKRRCRVVWRKERRIGVMFD